MNGPPGVRMPKARQASFAAWGTFLSTVNQRHISIFIGPIGCQTKTQCGSPWKDVLGKTVQTPVRKRISPSRMRFCRRGVLVHRHRLARNVGCIY